MAKFQKADYKKQYNFYSVVGKIGDILFYPIIIITLICCFAIFASKADNKVPTILGMSMVHINSGSMVAAGFEIGDIVFLHKTNVNKLRCGDIIAFYEVGSGQSESSLNTIQTYKITLDTTTNTSSGQITKEFDANLFNDLRDNERTYEDPTKSKVTTSTRILIHRIIGVYMKDDGTIFYKTQGDSNGAPDGIGLISENAVISKYIYTPNFVRDIFHFVSTSTGMIVLVVAPLCLLILFMLFSIIEQISKMGLEKRVLARLVSYHDPEVLKANIGIEMEIFDKAKFYATAEQKERNAVSFFLWGYLNNDKNQDEYQRTMEALKYLDKDSKKYWLFFIGSCKSKFQKRITSKYWQEWNMEQKMREKFVYIQKQKQKQAQEGKEVPVFSVVDAHKKPPTRPKKNKK